LCQHHWIQNGKVDRKCAKKKGGFICENARKTQGKKKKKSVKKYKNTRKKIQKHSQIIQKITKTHKIITKNTQKTLKNTQNHTKSTFLSRFEAIFAPFSGHFPPFFLFFFPPNPLCKRRNPKVPAEPREMRDEFVRSQRRCWERVRRLGITRKRGRRRFEWWWFGRGRVGIEHVGAILVDFGEFLVNFVRKKKKKIFFCEFFCEFCDFL
jgi:hypothetical protein